MMKSLFFLLVCAICSRGYCQDTVVYYPKVGEKIRDYQFKDVNFFSKRQPSIDSFKGRWLVLDFWSVYCSSCVKSFPHMDGIQRQFKNEVQVLLVGLYEKGSDRNGKSNESKIKQLYSYHAKKHSLGLPVAFDSLAAKAFDIQAVPFILVINPEGTVIAKTYSIDSVSLANLIQMKQVTLPVSYNLHEKRISDSFNSKVPLLTSGSEANGGIDTSFLSRSMLTFWTEKMPSGVLNGWDNKTVFSSKNNVLTAQAIGYDLPSLIRLSYFGLPNWSYSDSAYRDKSLRLILETKNAARFKNNWGAATRLNTFAFSVSLPENAFSKERIKKVLLNSLQETFDFNSKVEERSIKTYQLVVLDIKKVTKMRAKKGKQKYTSSGTDLRGFKVTNYSTNDLLFNTPLLDGLHRIDGYDYPPPIINNTGLLFNLDIEIDCDETDFSCIRSVLQKNGLDIVQREMKVKCIVIYDNNE